MIKQTDVLFAYTNINGFHSNIYNFGVGYLSSVLKKNGFDTKLVVVESKDEYVKLLDSVLKYLPKIVGFSAVSSQFTFVAELAKRTKEIHNCFIVCGGVHPTIFPECLLAAPSLDGIFMGESEYPFLDFTIAVTKGKNYREIDNFCYLEGKKLVKNRLRKRINNLAELPFPDRDIYDYQSVIDKNYGVVNMMTNRGCPFNCTYCSNHAIARTYGEQRNAIRYNSMDKVFEEIETLKSKYKFQRLWFEDDLFIFNKKWLNDFLNNYKKRFRIPFMCHIRPDVCTREIMFKLKEAGCYRIFLAVESANDYIRNVVMKRNISKQQLENTFSWAKETDIESLSVNIIGIPGDTEETIMETIDFNRRMNPTLVGVNIYSPYLGTELGDYCRDNNLIKDFDADTFYDRRESTLMLPTISPAKLMKLYDNFQYLVYKNVDSEKAKDFHLKIWGKRYRKLENNKYFGYLLRRSKKVSKALGKRIFSTK